MDRPLIPLEALGKKVSTALEAYSAERQRMLETARRRLLERVVGGSVRRSPWKGRGVALALAAGVIVAGALWMRAPRPLEFTADGEAGTLQSWVAAPVGRAVPVRFSDGTALRVEPASRVRVVAIDQYGASVAVENGALHADVVHKPESAWRVIAGPLTVRVTGTRFDLRWSALTEEFAVAVSEGSVAVTGAVLGDEQAVRAGETLRVSVAENRFELSKRSAPSSAAESAAAQQSPPAPAEDRAEADSTAKRPDAPAREADRAAGAGPAATSERAAAPDWRELARKGSLRKAFAAAESSGFEAACRTASAAELLELGDAARLSGRPDRANLALLTLRSRYPSDPRRAAAAFMLGKVAFDQSGAYAKAAEWFRTSIREQPTGSLSREASGRLMEALRKSGDRAGAERAAADYLARYPGGPHADLARSLVR